MPAVAALLDSRTALATLRRSLARGRGAALICRNLAALRRHLGERIVDEIVLGPQLAQKHGLAALRTEWPGVPIVIFGALRADDAEQLLTWQRVGVREVIVEGVDDAVVGDLVLRHTRTTTRREALQDAPALLRLTEPIQLRAWEVLMEDPGAVWETARLAERLMVSREHLSRQFGAGGAPNLKRVIDFLRVVVAVDLAGNPGLVLGRVAALTGFSSPTHLRATVRRITGGALDALAGAAPRGLLQRFVRVGRRSRG